MGPEDSEKLGLEVAITVGPTVGDIVEGVRDNVCVGRHDGIRLGITVGCSDGEDEGN